MLIAIIVLSLVVLILIYLMWSKREKHSIFAKISEGNLESNAKDLAITMRMPDAVGNSPKIRPIIRKLKSAYKVIKNKTENNHELYEFERWVYENYYSAIKIVNSRAYKNFALLPHKNKQTRIVAVSELIVDASYGEVTSDVINSVINTFNTHTPLHIEEIMALKDAIAYALLGKIAEIASKSSHYEKMRKIAEGKIVNEKYSASDCYLYWLKRKGEVIATKEILKRSDINIDNIEYSFSTTLIDNCIIVSNCFKALKNLKDMFSKTTTVEYIYANSLMMTDSVYASMDIDSKLVYLHALDKLAGQFNVSEKSIIDSAFALSVEHGDHFGRYIFENKVLIRAYLFSKKTKKLRLKDTSKLQVLYILAVFTLNTLLATILGVLTGSFIWAGIIFVLSGLAGLSLVEYIVQKAHKSILSKRPTPKLLLNEIPDNLRTMVVVPCFVGKEGQIKDICDNIKSQRAVNNGKNISFALLLDYSKGDNITMPNDFKWNNIFSEELSGFSDINCFVRRRRKVGKHYSGFERKRGAISELNEFLLTDNRNGFSFILHKDFDKPELICVLDADSKLLPHSLHESIATMAHPLNQKYDMMAFGNKFNMQSLDTMYSKQYYFDSGYESYNNYSSYYFDAFDKAIFCGKGIYRLGSFYNKLNKKLPIGKVLSHDIIEGALVNCGNLNECVYEDAPKNITSEIVRNNRWLAGDIQLTSFIGKKIKGEDGKKNKVDKKPIYNYIIFTNMLKGLAPMAGLTLVLISLITLNIYLSLPVIAIFGGKMLLDILDKISGIGKGIRLKYVFRGIIRTLINGIINFFMLPFYAINNLMVFLKQLSRMAFVRTDEIKWTTFIEGQGGYSLGGYFAMLAPSFVVMIAVSFLATNNLWLLGYIAYFFAVMFAIYPFGAKDSPEEKISDTQKNLLQMYARKTYNYFDLNRSENGLICDNYQLKPYKGKSKGTSPTNIGFSLIAEVSACELEIIDLAKAQENINIILDKIIKLDKFKGHLYNWYNIEDSSIMSPNNLSSVDSANFIASLIVTKEFLKQKNLMGREKCERIIAETDFEFMFDPTVGLFHISYNVIKKEFGGHYDLLASEAQILNYLATSLNRNTQSWYKLSRSCTGARGNILLSWSGTMFEYLMPSIFYRAPRGSLIHNSNLGAIKVQRSHKCKGFFGISESGYYKFDEALNYQYHAFGDNSLALRAENNRCVISPYSSFLAMQYKADLALSNLYGLYQENMFSEYGFYESIDFTGEKHIIYSHMAHHQGMILSSICNCLAHNKLNNYFMSDDRMRGGSLLLGERIPMIKTDKKPHEDYIYNMEYDCLKLDVTFDFSLPPKVAMLTKGNYSVVLNSLGGGVSKYNNICINKYREGIFENTAIKAIFKDMQTDEEFSPYPRIGDCDSKNYTFDISYKSATLSNFKHNVKERVYVPHCICGELREFSLRNDSDLSKQYQLNLYTDISISNHEAEIAHPVFSDMFINSDYDKSSQTVIYHRKSREKEGDSYCAVTLLTDENYHLTSNKYNAVGRLGKKTAKILPDFGDILYPCYNANIIFELVPNDTKSICMVVTYSDSITELKNMVASTQEDHFIAYAKKSAEIQALSQIGKLITSEVDYIRAINLASAVMYRGYSIPSLQTIYNGDIVNLMASFGISHTTKVVYFNYKSNDDMLNSATSIIKYLNVCNVKVALLIVYDEKDAYHKPIHNKISNLLNGDFPHIKLFEKSESTEKIYSYCFIDFKDIDTLARNWNIEDFNNISEFEFSSQPIVTPDIVYNSGEGGFDNNGDYIINKPTLLPYSNVVCMSKGGFIVTENGGGYCYATNSRENKLTSFDNEPIADTSSEQLLIQTCDKLYRINKLVANGYVKHLLGSTEFNCKIENMTCKTSVYLLSDGVVKVYESEIINESSEIKDITLKLAIKPCLGVSFLQGSYIVDLADNVVSVKRADTKEIMYLSSVSGDMDLEYNKSNLEILKTSINYNTQCKDYITIKLNMKILASSRRTIYFMISQDRELLSDLNVPQIHALKAESVQYFANLNKLKLKSLNSSCNILMSKYLMYQVCSSRLNGRCGYYQAGGAIGFRDQLQDCLAMLYSDPLYVREHIIECAKHQFVEGDVLHWWHPINLGVRTAISDDKLFLPYLVCEYIKFTGDKTILEEKAEFLKGEALSKEQESRYQKYELSDYADTIHSHCMKAIESASKIGEHKLLLIGSGDWNDALNDIGLKGRGESVWLSMFYYLVVKDYMEYMDNDERIKYLKIMDNLYAAINEQYVGGYYRRAFTDKGIWLGDSASEVCKIDLITQAFAVISGVGDVKKKISALNNAYSKLVDRERKIIKLLTPPFNKQNYCGYISSYPCGVRENGGQYSHAAAWYIKAVAMIGEREKALDLFNMINPIAKCSDKRINNMYMGEPYVLSGDVYTSGQMGWSWYSGSASWLYKIMIEDILGIGIRGASMTINPQYFKLLGDEYSVELIWKNTVYSIIFKLSNQRAISIDGVKYCSQAKNTDKEHSQDMTIPLVDSGKKYSISVEY